MSVSLTHEDQVFSIIVESRLARVNTVPLPFQRFAANIDYSLIIRRINLQTDTMIQVLDPLLSFFEEEER